MKTYYVKVAENGYIEGWGDLPEKNTVEVLAGENVVNKLFCVKIVNKKAVLDQEQFEKLQGSQLPEKTEIEKIREELLLTQEALAALFESNLG